MRGKPRFAIVGAGGMLARALEEELRARGEPFLAFTEAELDVTDRAAVERLYDDFRPAAVLNASGYTDVDGAETDVEAAERVNVHGAKLLAEGAARAGALLVHVSTDYVFDGSKREPYTEDDAPAPLSVYGRTKLAGEEAVRGSGARHLIVRTAWMFAPWGRNFVLTILRLAKERGGLGVVHDQTGSPTYAPDLAHVIADLALSGAEGTFNVVNSGAATWFDLAREAVGLAGLEVEVRPIPTAEYPRPATRPCYSVLSAGKLERESGRSLRHWKDALSECVPRASPTGA